MAKQMAILVIVLGLMVSLGACKQQASQQPATAPPAAGGGTGTLPPGHPQTGAGGAAGAPGIVMPPGEIQVVVPDSVKGKYGAVKLIIEDKMANKMQDVTVKIGSEYKVPNSGLKIKVGDFLPDFKMDGTLVTSVTGDLNNPAVHITVTENNKEIFKGWLYSKFPAIHPFQHEKYGLTLKDAVKG